MTHVKKLTIHGFKSFAPKTEINFSQGINTIVGPNGSGKSNISDAISFVLGRISAKSMRAQKSKNLLFMGSKYAKPSQQASVELVFDNSTGTFGLPDKEVVLKRIVKRTGQSTYKLNDKVRTRGEIQEILAHAGIDPYGFNIILQGNIQGIVKAQPDDRRKILEEVAGISIYETRKEKSFKELQKTEDRLKEIATILKERTSFLRNLEQERSQALRFKDLESNIKKYKASILSRKISDKEKEVSGLKKSITTNLDSKDKTRTKADNLQETIDNLTNKVTEMNKHMRTSSGLEQESLNTAVTNLKAEIEGLKVREEGFQNRQEETEKTLKNLQNSLPELQEEVKRLRDESPLMAKKQEELQKKKEELAKIQEEKENFHTLKSRLSSTKEMVREKERYLAKAKADSESTLRRLEELSTGLKYQDGEECQTKIKEISELLKNRKITLNSLIQAQTTNEKEISIAESRIEEANKIKSQVDEIDICPLCQTKISQEHIAHVFQDSESKIKESKDAIEKSQQTMQNLIQEKETLLVQINELEIKLPEAQQESINHKSILEKNEFLREILENKSILEQELSGLDKKRGELENKATDSSGIEEAYLSKIHEIEEISSRTEDNLDQSLSYKVREIEATNDKIKTTMKNIEEINENHGDVMADLQEKIQELEIKEAESQELNNKFKKMIDERDSMQNKITEENHNLIQLGNEVNQIDAQINIQKIAKARIDATKEALEMEMKEFSDVELIKGTIEFLEGRLVKSQDSINGIGSINLKALEVYDEVKANYDEVKERAEKIESEKEEVLRIITEIDKKKKRSFMKAFKSVNEIFSENFARLYTKGKAYLELENTQDPFAGGVQIVIKLAKGKYFDITSLSGGEQTLVAISLLFAIQEYKPYHFYIFDEIDAALDKRNSQRLSALLRKYMQNGQYIVITHNDSIITDSNVLYGVSMHEGISKVLSMKLD